MKCITNEIIVCLLCAGLYLSIIYLAREIENKIIITLLSLYSFKKKTKKKYIELKDRIMTLMIVLFFCDKNNMNLNDESYLI